MKIIDRYVASRFLVNFVLLGAALYVFGVSVDVVIQASRFLDAADTAVAVDCSSTRGAASGGVEIGRDATTRSSIRALPAVLVAPVNV